MAENRKGKDQRFYFTRNQLLLLGGAFVAAAVVIFFLGVFTGKGIEERRVVKAEDPLVKIPVKPAPPGGASVQGGAPKDELTFYNTLTKTKPSGAPSPTEEKPKQTKAAQKSAKTEVKESKAQSKEKPEPAPIPAGESAPAPKTAEKKAEKTPPPALAAKPVDKKAEKSSPAPATEKAAQSGEKAERGGKGWTVQVNAFPEEKSAKSWVDRLKNKGYNAYVVEVSIKGKTWYRVRVGNYSTREEAKKVEETLKTKENYPKAFTASR